MFLNFLLLASALPVTLHQDFKPSVSDSFHPIPIQVSVEDERYSSFFDEVSQYVGEETSDCALFVNKMLRERFNILVYGNAWDLQAKEPNKKYLTFAWSIPKSEVYRDNDFNFPWGSFSQRIDHFQELYETLDAQEYPIGVIGFIYKYSAYKNVLHTYPFILPQTHVVFVAGKKDFVIQNNTDTIQTIENILVAQHGTIKHYEWDFVNSKVPLNKVLLPGESFLYEDYLIEEHFRKAMRGSLLELFLRKHRNNRVEEILRPISFSRLSDDILDALRNQKEIFSHNNLTLVSLSEFQQSSWADDESWNQYLHNVFHISNTNRELFLPIPNANVLLGNGK